MGRSVSSPPNAQLIAYTTFEGDSDDWDFFTDNYVDQLRVMFPSSYTDDGWLGREDRIVARNRFAAFGISEHAGLVALWIVPIAPDGYLTDAEHGLAKRWIEQIAPRFRETFTTLELIGTASNGEAFFRRIK